MTPELWWNAAEPGDEIVFLPTGRKMGFIYAYWDMESKTRLIFAVYESEATGATHAVEERAEAFQPTGWKVPTRG